MSFHTYLKLAIFSILSIVLFGACDEIEDEFASDLQIDDQIITTFFTDTVTIETQIIKFDSVNTSQASNFMVGAIQDPVLGYYEAESYLRFVPARDSTNFQNSEEENPIFDSLVLVLPRIYSYGDTALSQRISATLLAEDFIDTVSYYQFSDLAVQAGNVVGSGRFPEDSDTSGIFRITMNPEVGEMFLERGSDGGILTREYFYEVFKGLQLKTDNPDGFVMGFDFANINNGGMQLFYHYEGDTSSTRYSFPIQRHFHGIKENRAGTVLQNLSTLNPVSTEDTDNQCFVQAGVGISTLISFPHLEKLDELESGTLTVHRAELRLVPEANLTTNLLAPPTALLFFEAEDGKIAKDANNLNIFVPSEDNPNIPLFLQYNSGARSYSEQSIFQRNDALMTNFIQSIVSEERENTSLIIGADQNNSSLNRLIFNDNHPNNDQRFTLRIYYTIAD